MRVEGKLWIDYNVPLSPPIEEVTEWLDETIRLAVTEYVGAGFFYVEGDEIVFNVGDGLDDVTKRDSLRDALEWDLDGHRCWMFHPDHPHHGSIGNAEARENLAKLRDLLMSVAADIDNALARPFEPEVDSKSG